MTQLPTWFPRDALIFRFDWWGPYKIVARTIGYTRHDNAIYFLGGSAEDFDRLIANARVMIDTDEQRLSYAMTRLEATRSFARTYLVLERFEDMKLLPESNRRRRHTRETCYTLRASHRAAPRGSGRSGLTGPGICAVRRQSVSRHRADRADGTSRVERTVLEAHTLMLPN